MIDRRLSPKIRRLRHFIFIYLEFTGNMYACKTSSQRAVEDVSLKV